MAEAKTKAKAKAKKVDDPNIVKDEPEAATEQPVEDSSSVVSQAAKAGKRSTKAQKEAAAKQAKEDRKATASKAKADAPKAAVKPPSRSRLERRGKAFRKSAEQLEPGKTYNLSQAVKLAKTTSPVKFDASVELHINLGVDPKQSEQNIRDNLVLPAGTGKKLRVAVLTDEPAEATKAGADIAGSDDFLAQLDKGVLNFDVLIATPNQMAKLGKYARVLGPRGLMPNPKSGTVTNDVNKAVSEAKAGRVEYRVDSTGIIHLSVGKVSFSEADLTSNIETVLASVNSNKPGNLKGNYLKSIYLATSMGPSVAIDLSSL